MRLLDQPKVYLIGEPMVSYAGMRDYLLDVGGQSWWSRVFNQIGDPMAKGSPAAESIVEFMGRLCYRSWEPGLNKNVTKIRDDRGDYILNVLRSGHGSVLSHCWFNFAIRGGSRVFTAEMNRHGIGTAISEQSLRFVRLDDIEFWEPGGLSEKTIADGRMVLQVIEEFMSQAYARELTDDMDFAIKKMITSKLRRWAPLGLATEEGWSANVRALRHVIEMRTALGAEEEIRIIVAQIAEIMQRKCPLLFGDYETTNPDGVADVFETEHRKV